MEEKKRIDSGIVERYHDAAAARAAREYFEQTVQRRELPAEMPEFRMAGPGKVSDAIALAGFASSKREAERLIAGGAVRVDGTPIGDPKALWPEVASAVLSVGARKFARVTR
jgi:tyrosyl-tRNA synthetase